MPSATQEVGDSNFDAEVMQSKKPVLVEFWASWCGPCQAMKPVVASFSKNQDQCKVVMVEVDRNPKSASAYNVMSVPTFLIIKEGRVKAQFHGSFAEAELKKKVEDALR